MSKATFFAVVLALASVGAPAVVAPNAEAKQTIIHCGGLLGEMCKLVPTYWWLEMLRSICTIAGRNLSPDCSWPALSLLK
ncbi:hypothetical protein FPV67DRAFT_1671769 [Lyophyllum atratum]|nr:hypothetical protein FPV67DRAFT_1671769 [Lyophyllum atratum]